MDDKTLERHRDNVRRMKQERRRTPEWHEKKRLTLARGWSRFHPVELDPDRSWYYDSYGASVTNKLKGLMTMNKQTQKQKLKSIRRRAIANQNNSPNKKTIAEAIKEVKNV